MSVDSPPTSETRNRRRMAMAVAAVVAVIGVAAIAINSMNSDDDVEPAPAAAPTVTPTTVAPTTVGFPSTGQVGPGRREGFFAGDDGVPVTFTVPQGWFSPDGSVVHRSAHPGRDEAGVAFMEVTNIYAEGCLVDPPVGPTVDDLVAAWANLPGFDATAAVAVTVDGYVGKQIEFTVPDYDYNEIIEIAPSGCSGNPFGDAALWWRMEGPDKHNQLWILDVDGTRVVIHAHSYPDTSPQDLAALDEVLASIQIG